MAFRAAQQQNARIAGNNACSNFNNNNVNNGNRFRAVFRPNDSRT